MFTKNNSYMFPHPSPSHPRFSGEIPLYHHHHLHHDMFPGHYLTTTAAALSDAGALNGDPSGITTKAASKKDRHSKIYTSQGPRDRRVRLSIGVARKFFDLQEILGFDKPSKTLDWLLTKSKAAIKDLVQMREKGSTDAAKSGASSAAPSECEVDSGEANAIDVKRKSASDKLKGATKEATLASNLAKESRAKARARARERTREKMSIKKLNEGRNNGGGGGGGYDNLNPTNPIQFMNNQLEFRKISGSSSSNINLGFHCHEAAQNEDLIHQESIVIKRKVKHHPSILGFQQNLFISSSNYAVPSPYNAAAENWDICAILDQHKFINSASNN